MKKKIWSTSVTVQYLADADQLIVSIKLFKKKWGNIAKSHKKPTQSDSNQITDKQMDINDCMEDYMTDGGGF